MMKLTCIIAFMIIFVPMATADEKKTEQLRKEITELKTLLAAKEAELEKLTPVNLVEQMSASNLKVGMAGPFVASFIQNGMDTRPTREEVFRVVRVIDSVRSVVKIRVITEVANRRAQSEYAEVILIYPTKNLADGSPVETGAPAYRVLGTMKNGDKTYFTIEPYKLIK